MTQEQAMALGLTHAEYVQLMQKCYQLVQGSSPVASEDNEDTRRVFYVNANDHKDISQYLQEVRESMQERRSCQDKNPVRQDTPKQEPETLGEHSKNYVIFVEQADGSLVQAILGTHKNSFKSLDKAKEVVVQLLQHRAQAKYHILQHVTSASVSNKLVW